MIIFFFLSKVSKLNVDFKNAIKAKQLSLIFQISPFEVVTVNFPFYDENNCDVE